MGRQAFNYSCGHKGSVEIPPKTPKDEIAFGLKQLGATVCPSCRDRVVALPRRHPHQASRMASRPQLVVAPPPISEAPKVKSRSYDEPYVEPYADHNNMLYFEHSFALHATEKALLCRVRISESEDVEIWVPKSQLPEVSEVKLEGDRGALVIPRFIAISKQLIPDDFGVPKQEDF